MDIEFELRKEHSKRQTIRIAKWIGTDPERLESFMTIFLHGDALIGQRGAWVVGTLGDLHPDLFAPHLKNLIAKMKEPNIHNAVKRNIVHLLQNVEIPRRLLGTVVSLCFDFLACPDETIAVKVFAMTVIARVGKAEPDLMHELRLIVDQQLPLAGGAFRSRARRIFKPHHSAATSTRSRAVSS
ncbi:MAG TPA: hypothetical protein VK470_03745 [Bacteroidota bacterium]|nr:hypothetical protein [Bacteroidota bacterium]